MAECAEARCESLVQSLFIDKYPPGRDSEAVADHQCNTRGAGCQICVEDLEEGKEHRSGVEQAMYYFI